MDFQAPTGFDMRRQLHRLGDAECRALALLWPKIASTLDAALDEFVARQAETNVTAATFERHGADIRAYERIHYSQVLSGRVDAGYIDACRRVCEGDHRFGLTLRVRTLSASIIMQFMAVRLRQMHPVSGRTLAHRIGLVTRALSLDLATIMTMHQEANERAAAQRQSAIDGAIGDFEQTVGAVIDSLQAAVRVLSQQSATMLGSVAQVNALTCEAGASAVEMQSNIDHTIAVTSGLEQSIGDISRQGRASLDLAVEGSRDAERAMQVMCSLARTTEEISSITKSISGLANQTNLLALNATIEAARAGEAGRGFSIVAQEVKILASHTESSTQDIGSQIQAVQASSSRSVQELGGVVRRINEIVDLNATISDAVRDQEQAASSISDAVRRTAQAIAAATARVESIGDVVARNVTAAEAIETWTGRLTRDADELNGKVSTFFRRVRQA